jgi:uncharacterized protein (DUF927 family)
MDYEFADTSAESNNDVWEFEKLSPDTESQWRLDGDGVYQIPSGQTEENKVKFIYQPVLILQRIKDIDTGQESIKIGWIDNGELGKLVVPRSTISSTGKLLTLADSGLAVNSGNAKTLMEYLMHLLDYRKADIPIRFVVSSCGWKTIGGQSLFMAGNEAIGGSETLVCMNPDADGSGLLSAFRQGGDFERWLEVARKLGDYPLAAFGVAAAFLPPMLNDMGINQNPIIDYSGKTTTGKSTLLRFIASVWGYPLEANGGLIRTWNSTATFSEDQAATLNELPMFVDESTGVKTTEVERFVYQYANGTGRGRGRQSGGVQKQAHIRGVLFSSGEKRLADFSQNDGIQARIIGFWGSPFGEIPKPELVHEISDVAKDHYGFAGLAVLGQYIQRRGEYADRLKAILAESNGRLVPQCTDSMGERLAFLCAAVEAAGRFASHVLNLGWDMRAIVDVTFSKLLENRKTSSFTEIIELLGSWLNGREISHAILPDGKKVEGNHSGVIGRYISDAKTRRVAILPDVLRRFLESRKYSYNTTLSHWSDRGWLVMDKGRKDKKVRFNGGLFYMVVLSEEGMKAAFGGNEDEAENVLKDMGYEDQKDAESCTSAA